MNVPPDPWMQNVAFYLALWLMLHLVMVGIWDVWCLTTDHAGYTVSSVIRVWSSAFPILTLAVGMLLGHLFWH